MLIQKESDLDEIKDSLMTVDRKKPWCSKLDLSGRTGSVEPYDNKVKEINALREMLELDRYEEMASKGSEDKWNLHLKNNPNLSAWADANPGPAQKLKTC